MFDFVQDTQTTPAMIWGLAPCVARPLSKRGFVVLCLAYESTDLTRTYTDLTDLTGLRDK